VICVVGVRGLPAGGASGVPEASPDAGREATAVGPGLRRRARGARVWRSVLGHKGDAGGAVRCARCDVRGARCGAALERKGDAGCGVRGWVGLWWGCAARGRGWLAELY
jgi:hypothetical protein